MRTIRGVWANSDFDGLESRVEQTKLVLDLQRPVRIVTGSLHTAAAEAFVSKAIDL